MKKPCILIIDDDSDDLQFLIDALSHSAAQNECVGFSSPVKALEYLESGDDLPAIIVSDINMPLVNGFELKKRVDKVLYRKNIPFIFISTSCTDQHALRMAGADCITKPSDAKGYREIAKHIGKMLT